MGVIAGYKQTELGVIPKDWDIITLGEIFTFKNGLNKGKEYFGFGTPIVNYMDVYKNSKLCAHDLKGKVNLSKQEIKAYEVKKGDVFFTRTSETVEEVGVASVMIDEPRDTVYSGFILRAHPKNEKLDDQFKRYCFSSNNIRKTIVSKATYTTRALTNGRILSGISMPLPPIPEQRAIANTLSDADALITSQDQLIAKKRDLKQAAMQDLLTGKRRLPGFSGVWGVKRFDQVFKKQNAKNHQIQTREYCENGSHPVIDQGKNAIVAYSDQSEKLFRPPQGGVIVFGDHTRIVKYADFDFLVGADGAQILTVEEKNSTKFFYYQLCVKEIPNTGYNRHYKFLKEMSFLVPTLPEQHAIAAVLSDMDTELNVSEQKRDKTKAIKQGMMQELLTGRIRLN